MARKAIFRVKLRDRRPGTTSGTGRRHTGPRIHLLRRESISSFLASPTTGEAGLPPTCAARRCHFSEPMCARAASCPTSGKIGYSRFLYFGVVRNVRDCVNFVQQRPWLGVTGVLYELHLYRATATKSRTQPSFAPNPASTASAASSQQPSRF